ncbi:tetratricopeptide repeat protein [Pseudomonas fluorescens]|uniref:tetratricopeptide repeat protein n=1 Tax=Pseudomonas fluorescens TaxID=294 RepID=UPI000935D0CB|nr:tetratricopeptide repeat protein [Pseudomonas fluorescens]
MRQSQPPARSSLSRKITPQTQLSTFAAQFRHAMAQQDYSVARLCCEKALKMMPGNMSVLSDYALCLLREGRHAESYAIYQQIYQSPQRANASATWLDGLTEVCGWLGKTDELRRYGYESLTSADESLKHCKKWQKPQTPLKPFDASHPEKNVIAFSLYGDQPRYCETLIENASLARELYPAWTCRVYLDNSVPTHVQTRLQRAGMILVDMSAEKQILPTLWRFLVMDDPSVERFIVRDADSLLSEREAAAVEEWLDSPFHFHHMRDYFTHTELLLAGLWGGVNGYFPPVEGMMRAFIQQYQGSERFTDQSFLRHVLWPTIRESLLSHDNIFGFHQARRWPQHKPIRWQHAAFHVGSNTSYSSLSGPCGLPEGERQPVDLVRQGMTFRYYATVKDGQWFLGVPFFLVDEFKAGTMRVVLPLPGAPHPG